MSLDDVLPSDYWRQRQEDIELVTLLNNAKARGMQRADAEERKARKAEQDKAEWERRERESKERARAKAGLS